MNEDNGDQFSIRRITGSFSASEDIVIDQTATTCLVFRPKVHPTGVRGELIRFKLENGVRKEELVRTNFTKLKLDEGNYLVLSTESIARLIKRVHELYLANKLVSPWKLQENFKVAKADTVIDDTNKGRAIKQLLQKGYSDDFWDELVASDPDLATRLSWAKIYENYDAAVREFRASMADKGAEESYWQSFFEKHPWMLQQAFPYPVLFLEGDVYVGGKIAKGRQGLGGVATDFLFTNESSRSFAVVEIKTPDESLVGQIYRGKDGTEVPNEIYTMHSHLTGAIVQTQNQIKTACEQFTAVLKTTFGDDLNATHPHGILITGKLDGITGRRLECFNHFRFAIKDITIVTFDELLRRVETVLAQINPNVAATRAEDDEEEVDLRKIPS